jgi:sulfur-carrier protein
MISVMPKVTLTANLKKYFPENQCEINATSLISLLNEMDKIREHFSSYILDEHRHIRKHVNIFINNELYRDKENTNLPLEPNTEVHIMQALSGG